MAVLVMGLALGCGTAEVAPGDQGADAVVLDLASDDGAGDTGTEDEGVEEDAGWCVSDQCITRLRFDHTCLENVRNDFPCDDEDERTYDDRCSAVGVCEGVVCECDAVAGCCDGCNYMPAGDPCTTAPPFNNPASCVDIGAGVTACQGPPVTP